VVVAGLVRTTQGGQANDRRLMVFIHDVCRNWALLLGFNLL
jgi:hypothetical protein